MLNDNLFFVRFEVLLALGLVFYRGSSVSAMMECRMGDIAIIYKSTA